jgi:hypothetical protein
MGAAEVEVPIESLDGKDVGAKIENLESASASSQDLAFDEKATRRLIRKIDWTLLPFLALLYLLSFLDRTNIGNARLAGLEKDIGMSGLDYNVSIIRRIGGSSWLTRSQRVHLRSSFRSTSPSNQFRT